MRIGVLGGTFDPIHIGHLTLAESVRVRLGMDKVLFVPAGNPYLKPGRHISEARHRVEMVRLAIQGSRYFEPCNFEVLRSVPSYTVDTIVELRQRMGAADEFYFILGWDSLLDLPGWHEPARLTQLCYLVAVPRVGYPVPDLKKMEKKIPGISAKVIILDEPLINVSATVIRLRVRRGLSIKHLVPEPVSAYIEKHRLYKC